MGSTRNIKPGNEDIDNGDIGNWDIDNCDIDNWDIGGELDAVRDCYCSGMHYLYCFHCSNSGSLSIMS